MHGVGGDALGGVDGGGVAEARRSIGVVRRESDRVVAAGVPHGQATVLPDISDGPAVAVFDPVGAGEARPAVVGAGDDHISDTRLVPSASRTSKLLLRRLGVAAGSTVEFGD